MYAIISTGGKQYRVTEGQTLKIERLAQEAGASIKFDDILLIGEGDKLLHIGSPQVKGAAKVTAEIVNQRRDTKISIIKFKRRKHHMKRMGHRQNLTTIKVTGISLNRENKEKIKKKRYINNGS